MAMSAHAPRSAYNFGARWKTHRDGLVDLVRSLMYQLASIEHGIQEAHILIAEHREAVASEEAKQNVKVHGSEASLWELTEANLSGSSGSVNGVKSVRSERKRPISRLAQLVPTIGQFFTPLDLVAAFKSYDDEYCMSAREHVGPSFSEIRHVLNLAQLDASRGSVRLVTFDADGTLYSDGRNLELNSPLLQPILDLLDHGLTVAIVTAAGYPKDCAKYEMRFGALLERLSLLENGEALRSRFFVVGGESNYLFRVTAEFKLEWVDPDETPWMLDSFHALDKREGDVQAFLDQAVDIVTTAAANVGLAEKMFLIRKPRAIGYVSRDPLYVPRKEMLNEVVFEAQESMASWEEDREHKVPFCAFNSGRDVWVDIGHKAIAVESLQQWLKVTPEQTLHIGDQMDAVGNDVRARLSSPSLWVANPNETGYLLKRLLSSRAPITQDS